VSAITVRLDPTTAEHYLLIRRGIPSCACGVSWPTDRFLGITEHLVESNAPRIVAAVREQVAAETAALVRALQAMCDDEWLRRRDRIMRLPGARYMRDSGSGEIEYAAHMVRSLIEDLPGYDATATGGTYLDWMRNDRDEGTERIARGESS